MQGPPTCAVIGINPATDNPKTVSNLLRLLDAVRTQYAVRALPRHDHHAADCAADADDIMLGHQSTSFHDALYLRQVLGLRPAPEFEAWLSQRGIFSA